jgi:cytochrome c-type biogenesis protein CcmH/NrfG
LRRPLVVAAGTVAAGVLVVLLLTGSLGGDHAPATTTHPDLSEITNEEMEAVLAENPDDPALVPMRLALVERYLDDGDVARAHARAQEALAQANDPGDRARSLRYVGWTIALLGQPVDGERFLRQSLEIEPDHADSLWFLARVLFEGQARPADAVPLLEQILSAEDLPADRRPQVQAELDQAQAAVAGAPNPTLPTVPA